MWRPIASVRPSVWNMLSTTEPYVGLAGNSVREFFAKIDERMNVVKIGVVTVMPHSTPPFSLSLSLSIYLYIIFLRNSPQWAMASSFTRFLDHTQRRITVSRTPLDE